MNPLRALFCAIVVLCLLCAHCNLAKPTHSMTRIQEVFRALMGAKPMMLASRGKKSLVALPSAREILAAADEDDVDRQLGGGGGRGSPADELADDSSSYWIVADERLPVVAVRLNER